MDLVALSVAVVDWSERGGVEVGWTNVGDGALGLAVNAGVLVAIAVEVA